MFKPFVASLFALVPGVAIAEGEAVRVVNGQTFGAWQVTCEALAVGETACVLNQHLLRDSDQAFLAQFLALWSDDGEKRYLLARVPVGVYLPYGMAIKPEVSPGDEGLLQLVWQSCNAQICEALVELDADHVATYTAEGVSMVASYRPSLSSEPLVFRFAMQGIVEGMDALPPVR